MLYSALSRCKSKHATKIKVKDAVNQGRMIQYEDQIFALNPVFKEILNWFYVRWRGKNDFPHSLPIQKHRIFHLLLIQEQSS